MSRMEWERELVELPFCRQLERMGWQWIEGDPDLPETTERASSREVLLRGRLAAALRKLNLRDGKPWLDEARIARAIRDLEQAAGHRLLEVNQSATELLLKGTVVEGLPDWDFGRPQPVKFIDFENPAKNDFLVINQFKVELTSGRGHVIPDAVLFVNGIPLVVGEFKSPAIQNPLQEAINQLLRYSNQRREIWPTLYTDNEGVERLFHTNQLLIASNFFEARAATIGAPPEAYLEWADTSPVPMTTVAQELGVVAAAPALAEAAQELATLGPEQAERTGTPLFFREPAKQPPVMRGAEGGLQSQQILVAGMLRPAHLLDLIRNFTVFQQVDGKTRKVVARYQQFRSIHKAVARLLEGRTRARGAVRDERGGIVWHTQGSGKSLGMVFLVRRMRMMPRLNRFKVVVVTDRTDLEEQLRETARLSGETLRPNENDVTRRESPTARTQRILQETTPDIVFAMLQKYQDTARLDAAEKVAMTIVRKEKKPGKEEPVVEKQVTLEEDIHFEDFPVLNESEEILVLVDEAHRSHTRSLHRNLRKALPNAAIIGFTGTPILRKEKTERLEALPCAVLALPDNEVEKLDADMRFLVQTYPQLPKLRALEIAAVFSANHNDPEAWWDWSDKGKQDERIRRFKRKLASEKTDKTDPLSILVVNNMLLTGFDAPVEQVLYLDRKLVAHDLLQAIARVNRTCGQKKCGYVVDYIGVARHLNEALKDYDGEDTEGINAHVSARGVDPKVPPTTITDAEFEKVLAAQSGSRARAAQMQHAARFHIIGFSNQNPIYARKMSEKLAEILRRFKDDWDALERELRKFIEELKRGDRNEFPNIDPRVQVPFVRLVLEECSKARQLTETQRKTALVTTLEMVERIQQEIRAVGFWKNAHAREMLTRRLVRDLDQAAICKPGGERDLAQRLVALAKENHENLTRP